MYQIGIDIGGTSVKIGLVDDSSWTIVQRGSFRFEMNGAEAMAASMRPVVDEVLAKQGIGYSELESIGVIVPGSLSSDGSTVLNAFNLGFHDVPLRTILEKTFPGVSVFLVNDADGAALAELGRGAFAGRSSGILLTLGTGLGGGIILNGKLFTGGMNHGCELGHAFLVDGGEHCSCGNDGCMEAYVSATAIIREGRKAAAANPDCSLAKACGGNLDKIDARMVIDCARTGDAVASEVFSEYVDHLASVCASLFNILDPEIIAIGGGVSGAGEFLFKPLRERATKKCFYKNHGDIVPAVMGNDAGIIGAAMLCANAK